VSAVTLNLGVAMLTEPLLVGKLDAVLAGHSVAILGHIDDQT